MMVLGGEVGQAGAVLLKQSKPTAFAPGQSSTAFTRGAVATHVVRAELPTLVVQSVRTSTISPRIPRVRLQVGHSDLVVRPHYGSGPQRLPRRRRGRWHVHGSCPHVPQSPRASRQQHLILPARQKPAPGGLVICSSKLQMAGCSVPMGTDRSTIRVIRKPPLRAVHGSACAARADESARRPQRSGGSSAPAPPVIIAPPRTARPARPPPPAGRSPSLAITPVRRIPPCRRQARRSFPARGPACRTPRTAAMPMRIRLRYCWSNFSMCRSRGLRL